MIGDMLMDAKERSCEPSRVVLVSSHWRRGMSGRDLANGTGDWSIHASNQQKKAYHSLPYRVDLLVSSPPWQPSHGWF